VRVDVTSLQFLSKLIEELKSVGMVAAVDDVREILQIVGSSLKQSAVYITD